MSLIPAKKRLRQRRDPAAEAPNTNDDDFEGWYVVQTKRHWERRVCEELEAFGIESYLPMEKAEVKHARRLVETERPFLPRFIFVYAKVKGDFHRVKRTLGVDDFLRVSGRPRIVPGGQLERLQRYVDRQRRKFDNKATRKIVTADGKARARFAEGEAVKVVDGPFAGFSGVVERGAEARKGEEARTFRVLTFIFGRVTPVELEAHQLESLSTPPDEDTEDEELQAVCAG